MTVTAKKIPSRNIKEETTRMLWAVSAGICEFSGCTNRLYTHHVTKENVNLAKRAHIYAFSQGGKRYSPLKHTDKINEFDNLMLVCDRCHDLIDSPNTEYSAEQLIQMKREHEERMYILTSIKSDLQSEVIIYTCAVGDKQVSIKEYDAVASITPEHYPARMPPISLHQKLELFDYEDGFWATMSRDLERQVRRILPSIKDKHISLFAVAPQPLLFKLGRLLNRNYDVDVRQSQGDISHWRWPTKEKTIELVTDQLSCGEVYNKAAITIEISAQLSEVEIAKVFDGYDVHRIVAPNGGPQSIRSMADLQAVTCKYRELLNKIRLESAPDVQVALLFIAPASVSIEAGRQLMKGDPHITVYDRNALTKAWIPALHFPGAEEQHD